jgi:predicted nucleic acid-binding protein
LADLLAETSSTWDIVGFTPGIIRRARKSFPVEPIRALDAIHLASALAVCDTVDDLAILTFDDRIRRVAQAMGLGVTP